MKHKSTLAAVFMMVVMLFGLLPAQQPVAALTTCDWAQFVSDVTVADGTVYAAGAPIVKTWKIKNIGSCTWTGYSLVFVDGTAMGAPASTAIPGSIAPGATVNLTVNLTAPASNGTYRANFQLKNASSVQFGIGSTANKSFWVEIKVGSGGSSSDIAYDFVGFANDPGTTWSSGTGARTFPGTDPDVNGFAKKLVAPITLENGGTDAAPGLLVAPDNNYNGFIQGQYPAFTVQSGDHFQSIINCERNATSCYVNFRLNYQIGSGPVQTFWKFNEKYEGLFYRANVDLSSLAGQSVKFILYVGAAGYATGDRAVWGGPRITRAGAVPLTPVPPATAGPSPTPSNTPVVSTSDRVTFISDVTVLDGSSFAPNTPFVKTWRIKNTGTSTWTTSYKLVFVSGDLMGGVEVPLTSTVAPNTSFNISVNLTSPSAVGTYRGYWQLKNASSVLFGIGSAADKPWWVDIAVKSSGGTSAPSGTTVFDFTTNPGAATWTGSGGVLTFPGTEGNSLGFAIKQASTKLQNNVTDTRSSLLTVPQNATDGYIQGVYPVFSVLSGDRFRATIGCEYLASSCDVNFSLFVKKSDATIDSTFWTYHMAYGSAVYDVNIDLSAYAGQNVQFIPTILANGSATGDRAIWIAPRITR